MSDGPRKIWLATWKLGFIARCETREEAMREAAAKSKFGTAWATNEDTGEIWQRSVVGEEWSLKKRAAMSELLKTSN